MGSTYAGLTKNELTKNEANALLKKLRDDPAGMEAAKDDVLVPLFIYVDESEPAQDGKLHWFCSDADATVKEAATFLLRLFAYSSDRVQRWMRKLIRCLHGCCACVCGFEEVKITSEKTYFGAFPAMKMAEFWTAFEKWEVQKIIDVLADSDITVTSQISIAKAPTAVVFHLLSTLEALCNPTILSILRDRPPTGKIVGWPDLPPPPGLLLLLMHESVDVQKWARTMLQGSRMIPDERLTGPYISVMQVMTLRLSQANASLQVDTDLVQRLRAQFPFPNTTDRLWHSFIHILANVPLRFLRTQHAKADDIRIAHLIVSHLHDRGPHFPTVVRAFAYLCKKLGKDLWDGESSDYPQVVFDSIKDNPAFANLLLTTNDGDKNWILTVFPQFVWSVWSLPIFSELFPRMAEFMLGELQHERFIRKRPIIMDSAAKILEQAISKAVDEKATQQCSTLTNVLDVHSELLISVAFSPDYSRQTWASARRAVLELLQKVLVADVGKVASAVVQLSQVPKSLEDIPAIKPVRRQIWREMFKNVQANDPDGLCLILALSARTSRIDQLTKKAFSSRFGKYYRNREAPESNDILMDAVETAVDDINSALAVFRSGILDAVSRFANRNTSTTLLELLQRPGVAKQLLEMMLSPVEDLQVAAQTLVGQAFDVDERSECFKALLENMPDQSYRGLQDYVEKFNNYAPQVIEACSTSKALVRCLTDVLEVLGNSPDGLLLNERYIRNVSGGGKRGEFRLANELVRLWTLMTSAITVIFKRTPSWAPYFDNLIMIEWMRDALIFGRDLLARRNVFENAILMAREEDGFLSPRKLSPVGTKMVMDLQNVLRELQAWLRLTDFELLHQSYKLLRSLLRNFRDIGARPAEETLKKLSAFIEAGRKRVGNRPVSLLNDAQLSVLENDLAEFEDSDAEDQDDDIEIISFTQASKPAIGAPARAVDTKRSVDRAIKSESKQSSLTSFAFGRGAQASSTISERIKPQRSAAQPIASGSVKALPSKQVAVKGPKFEGASRLASSAASTSASSDESSEEEEMSTLKSLTKLQKSPVKIPKQNRERRQIKIIDDPMTNAESAMQRRLQRHEEARRNTLRLKPDVSALHRMILSWDYDHAGSEPPFPGSKPRLVRVPDRFPDPGEYRRAFEPLLLFECWAQIVKSKEEIADSYSCKVASRQFVDNWLDIDVIVTEPVKKDWRVSETEVVLLRNSATNKSVMAKGLNYRSTPTGVQVSIRCIAGSYASDPGLQVNTIWRISVVFSLTTLHREYAALMALPYYDLLNTILNARLPPPATTSEAEIERAMKSFQLNRPQAKAVVSAMRTNGFTLIQGPPGTGKTSTICALVGSFLSNRRNPASVISVGRTTEKQPRRKILLCAPSNAAIDEVAKRLMDGVRDSNGARIVPNVVRVGAETAINVSVQEISLESLIDQKLNASGQQHSLQDFSGEIASIHTELAAVKEKGQKKKEEQASIHDNASRLLALEDEIRALNSKRISLSQRLNQLKDKRKSENRTADATRRIFRQEVLNEADIICSTLSGSGHEFLDQFDFDMLIIDEAAQSIELSSLIPLKYRCSKCIMVGDPNQLPPTVLSLEATKWGYDQSLFVRMQKQQPDSVHLLSIQYRMHPQISQLPSQLFYSGRLKDGPDMEKKTHQAWHDDEIFGPYKFYNVTNGREESGAAGHSYKNVGECQVILALFDRLRRQYSKINFDYRIGIVSMYRSQVSELRRIFQAQFGQEVARTVDFNTVDGFQGQEKDIIILSCVRAGPGVTSVGFLSDVRRMNVAITRSRSSLFIVGNAATLERSETTWRRIVSDARSRKCLTEADTAYFRAPTNPARDAIEKPLKTANIKRQRSKGGADESPRLPKKVKEFQLPLITKAPSSSSSTSLLPNSIPQGESTSSSAAILVKQKPKADVKPAQSLKRAAEEVNGVRPVPAPPQGDMSRLSTKKAERALKALEKRKRQAESNPFLK